MNKMEGTGLVTVVVLAVLANVPPIWGGVAASDTEGPQQCQNPFSWTTIQPLHSNGSIPDNTVWSVSQSFAPNRNFTEAASLDVSSKLDLTFADVWQYIYMQLQHDGYAWNSQTTTSDDGYVSINQSFCVNDSFWSVGFLNNKTDIKVSLEIPFGNVTLTASAKASKSTDKWKIMIDIANAGKPVLEFVYRKESNTYNKITPIYLLFNKNGSKSIIFLMLTINGIQKNVFCFKNNTYTNLMVCYLDDASLLEDQITFKGNSTCVLQNTGESSRPPISTFNCNFLTVENMSTSLNNFDLNASFDENGDKLIVSLKTYKYLNGSGMSPTVCSFCNILSVIYKIKCNDYCGVVNTNSKEIQTKEFQWTSGVNAALYHYEQILVYDYDSMLNFTLHDTFFNDNNTPAGSLSQRVSSQQTATQKWTWAMNSYVKKDVTGFNASLAISSVRFNPSLSILLRLSSINDSAQNVEYCSSMPVVCSLVESSNHVQCNMSSRDMPTSTTATSSPTTHSTLTSGKVSETITKSTSKTGTSTATSTHTPTTVATSSASPKATVFTNPSTTTLSTTLSANKSSTVTQSIQALKTDSHVIPIAVGVAVSAVIIILLAVVLIFLVRRRRRHFPRPVSRAGARRPYDDLDDRNSSDQTRIYTELNGNSGQHLNGIQNTGQNELAQTSDYYSVIKDGAAKGAFEPMDSIYDLAKSPFSEATTNDPAPRRNLTDETNFSSSPYELQVKVDVPPELPPKKKSACIGLHDKYDDKLDMTPSNDCTQHQSQGAVESLYDTVRASAALPNHDGLSDTVNRTATSGHFRPDSQGSAVLRRTGDYHFLDPEPEEPAPGCPPLPPKTRQAVDGSGLYHYLDPETTLQPIPDDLKESYQLIDINSDTDPSRGDYAAVRDVDGEYSSLNVDGKKMSVHDETARQEVEVYSHLQGDEGNDYSRLDRERHGHHVLDEDYNRLQQ